MWVWAQWVQPHGGTCLMRRAHKCLSISWWVVKQFLLPYENMSCMFPVILFTPPLCILFIRCYLMQSRLMIPAADSHRKGIKISVDWLHAELKWSQGLATAPHPHPIWAESHQTRSQHVHERTLTPPVSLFTATFHAVHWGQPHVQRNRLRGVWISLPHHHGAVCAGHHRNVQRAQQVSPELVSE